MLCANFLLINISLSQKTKNNPSKKFTQSHDDYNSFIFYGPTNTLAQLWGHLKEVKFSSFSQISASVVDE